MAAGALRPDWRDASAYEPIAQAESPALAWEWLRRDPAYQAAVCAKRRGAAQFGLHRFEDPLLATPLARPVWRKEVDNTVIDAAAEMAFRGDDTVRIDMLGRYSSWIRSSDHYHLLISDGLRFIRVDLATQCEPADPLALRFELAGLGSLGAKITALERLRIYLLFRHLKRGPLALSQRQILLLRAADALAEGMSQRQIAAELLDKDAASRGWRLDHPSIRTRAQRLVRRARAMANGGFRTMLARP